MKLVLEDGRIFEGTAFGADREVGGEVVFHTGMTGYPELLTDPAYRGQILVLSYPLQGNYGVARGPFESDRIQVQGLVISTMAVYPNHHASVRSLAEWLEAEGVPGLQGVDTRAIACHLRAHGSMRGYLLRPDAKTPCEAPRFDLADAEGWALEVHHYPAGPLTVLAIDFGMRESAIRSLTRRGVSVLRYPASARWEEALPQVAGVLLSSGPGDPADWRSLVTRLARLLEGEQPLMGICLGHQLLALAAGGRTFRLAHGHRSSNQPVLDLRTQRAYSTSQNHGYAVEPESLPAEWEPWCINLHDGSNEGLRHRKKPFLGVQFHPEAAAGPRDTSFLFDEFVSALSLAHGKHR